MKSDSTYSEKASASFQENLSETDKENTINLPYDKVVIDSLPVEGFVEQHIAENIQCNICLGVPLSPVMTRCGHFHCERCLNKWLDTADTCTACRRTLTMDDISEVHGFCENVHQVLHVYCTYKEKGCTQTLLLRDLDAHEINSDKKDNRAIQPLVEASEDNTAALAPALPRQIRRLGPNKNKLPLHKAVDTKDCRKNRLKPFYDSFDKLCNMKRS